MQAATVTRSLAALSLLAGIAAGANAATEGPYAGGALGAPNYVDTINGVGGGNGGRGPGLKLYGGYQLSPNLAVEGGYFNLGRSDRGNGGTARAQGLYVDGIGSVEFAPRWSLLGSVGLAQARLRTSVGNDSSPALKLGVGLQYDLTKTTALRLGYDHYRFIDAFDGRPNVGQAVFGVQVGF
ncbi:MAG: outer membrane beta-barrel protein [Rubrivivax sp.]